MKELTFQSTLSCRFTVHKNDRKCFIEEILFSQTLQTTTKSEDVSSALSRFLAANNLPWENVVEICTDGTQVMTGCHSGFVVCKKKKGTEP